MNYKASKSTKKRRVRWFLMIMAVFIIIGALELDGLIAVVCVSSYEDHIKWGITTLVTVTLGGIAIAFASRRFKVANEQLKSSKRKKDLDRYMAGVSFLYKDDLGSQLAWGQCPGQII